MRRKTLDMFCIDTSSAAKFIYSKLWFQDQARCAWWRSGWAKWLSKSGNTPCPFLSLI